MDPHNMECTYINKSTAMPAHLVHSQHLHKQNATRSYNTPKKRTKKKTLKHPYRVFVIQNSRFPRRNFACMSLIAAQRLNIKPRLDIIRELVLWKYYKYKYISRLDLGVKY